MPLHRIAVKPGVNSQLTQTQNRSSWWASNLVRWQNGLLEKIGGWLRLIPDQAAGLIRAMHAYQDLSLTDQLLLGTDGGAQIYNSSNGLNTFIFGRRGTDPSTTVLNFTNASASLAIHDVGSNVTVGGTVTLLITVSGGNRIYLAGTQWVVATKVDADNYTVTLPAAALSDADGATPEVSTGGGIWTIPATGIPLTIHLVNHGLVPGNSFAIQFDMGQSNPLGGLVYSLPVGIYTVGLVLSADYFTLTGQTMTATIASPVVDAENNGDIPLIYPSSSQPTSVSNWSLDNFGQIGLINYQDGPIFAFTPPVAGLLPSADQIIGAPTINTGMFVAMPQAQIIAFGADVSGVQDPMLVRWCDTSDFNNWIADSSNQAGSYRLSQGSRLVGGIQAPQTTLLWTDTGIWTMQYTGPPFVYNLYEIGTGCGLIASNARAILNSSVYWMGDRQFYVYDGQGMRDLPCDVWDFVFNDIDSANASKCFAGSNSAFNEVFFFFPSASGGTGEIDSYVKLTAQGGSILWDTGRLARTSWIDQSVFGQALAGDLNRRIQQHDIGYDDDGAAMAGVYVESGYVDVSDGDDIMLMDEIIPDMKWFGDVPGGVSITLKGTMYPQGSYRQKGPYGMDMANKHIRPRMRARQIAIRVDWLARLGFSARFGDWRFRAKASGKRP